MRAVTQEISNKLKRMSLEEFRDTPYGRVIQKMMDFNAQEDYQDIVNEIENYNPNLKTSILTRLYGWYLQDYFKDSSLTDKLPHKIIMKSKDIETLMKKFQERINRAGRDLNKKVLRFSAEYSKDKFGIDLEN